ncbi:hypothetical protein ACLOJK_025122 [Asimina triloba]
MDVVRRGVSSALRLNSQIYARSAVGFIAGRKSSLLASASLGFDLRSQTRAPFSGRISLPRPAARPRLESMDNFFTGCVEDGRSGSPPDIWTALPSFGIRASDPGLLNPCPQLAAGNTQSCRSYTDSSHRRCGSPFRFGSQSPSPASSASIFGNDFFSENPSSPVLRPSDPVRRSGQIIPAFHAGAPTRSLAVTLQFCPKRLIICRRLQIIVGQHQQASDAVVPVRSTLFRRRHRPFPTKLRWNNLSAVAGRGFIARDITFENTAGPEKHQAVALRSDSDLSAYFRCGIYGYQDTLYAHSLRQFYRECRITGTIDFIFGNAAAVFQTSQILARKPLPNQKNTITAHGRKDPNQYSGFSIHNCNVTGDADLIASRNSTAAAPTYLGRPWKLYSVTVFMHCFMGGVIRKEGWLEWAGDFALSTLYYGEYMNDGPGAGLEGRVVWPGYHVINDSSVANNFTVANFIDGNLWLPATGVRYTAGLGD